MPNRFRNAFLHPSWVCFTWVGLTLILLAQGAWLIPELAARADIIIAGREPPPSYAHAIYSSLELVKIGVLLLFGFKTLSEQR